MSTAAKFLLEFQATGDQEIVQKLRDIGTSGQQAATELQDLQGAGEEISQSLTDVGTAAEGVAGPMEEMATGTEELGGIFAEAGTASTELGAGLEEVGTAGEAAAGGLTETTTLTEGLGSTMGETTKGTASLKGGFAGLGLGMTSLIGTGVSLFNSFDAIGDAQVRVDAANLKMQKTTAMLNSQLLALSKTTQKMVSDTSLNIKGVDEFSAAQAEFNELVKSGVTSGDQYDASLQRLQKAQDGLSSSTTEGNNLIEQAGIQLDKVAVTAGRTAVVQNDVANANEALNEQWANLAQNTLPTLVAGISGTVAGFAHALEVKRSLMGQIGKLSGVYGKLSGVIGKAVMPIRAAAGALTGLNLATGGLIGILGPAALAVGGFLLAIKGIEAIKPQIFDFFNGMGKALGDLIPQLKGFLTDLGNAAASTTDFLIRNTNRLLGQEQFVAENTFQLVDLRIKKSKELSMEEMDSANKIIESARRQGESFEEAGKRILPILWREKEGLISTKEASILMAGASDTLTAKMKLLAAGTADNMVATEGISSAIASLPGSIDPATTSIKSLTSDMSQGKTVEEAFADTSVVVLNPAIRETAKSVTDTGKAILTDYLQPMKLMITGTASATTGAKSLATASVDLASRLIATGSAGGGAAVGVKAFASAAVDLASTVGKVETAVKDMNMELTATNYSLKAQIIGLQDATNQEIATSNAILEVTVALEQSNQKLRETRAIRDSVTASAQQLQTTINNELAALIEEESAIRGSIASLRDLESNQQRVKNAYLEGVKSIDEWNIGLSEAAAEERGAMQRLDDLGFTFDDLPGHIEPTIENLMAYAEATVDAGGASERFKEISISAFQDLTSEATPLIQQLADLISNPPLEDAGKKWAEAWSGIGANVKAALDDTTIAFTEQRAALSAAGGEAATAWAISFAANFETGAANAERIADQNAINLLNAYKKNIPEMAGSVDQLINIIKTKGPQATQAILRGLEEGVPLAELIGRDYGEGTVTGIDAGLDGIVGTADDKILGPMGEIPPKAKEIGLDVAEQFGLGWANVLTGLEKALSQMPGFLRQKGAEGGAALAEGIAAAGTHIAAVIKGINAQLASIGAGGKAAAIQVDIAPALKQLQSLKVQIDSVKQTKIPKMGVNIQNIMQNTAKSQKLINDIKQKTPPRIGINIQNVLQNAARSIKAINSIKQGTPPRIGLNIQNALQNVARVKNAIAGIRGRTVYIDVRQRLVGPRYAATGFHGEVSQPTMIMVGEKGRERVSIEPVGAHHAPMGGTKGGYGGGGGGGGNGPAIFKGDVILDGHKVGRVMGRLIAENNV